MLYIILSVLSMAVVLIEIIASGSVMDKGVVLIAFWGGLLAFIFWLCHIWIKHTKYMGLCFVLVTLLYGCLYFFYDLKFT